MTTSEPALPLPTGTVLLHIGPQKTGTTAIQSAFHRARRALLQQGVRYAGPNRQSKQAARALTRTGAAETQLTRHSRRLVREVRNGSAARVVISAEAFADADDAAIPQIVEALGGERVHVAITLRPLARILPSQWQQFVQGGLAEPFDRFLRRVLDAAPVAGAEPTGDSIVRRFWRRHRHDRLIARWAEVVGSSRVTAIALDEANRDRTVRPFEQLLGLGAGTLAVRHDVSNRSLTLPEAELLRELNRLFAAHGIDPRVRAGLIPFGVTEYLKARRVGSTEPQIGLPAWALDHVLLIASDVADGIRASGVSVIGDLVALGTDRGRASSDQATVADPDWANLAGAASLGFLVTGGFARSGPGDGASAEDQHSWPDDLATVSGRPAQDLSAISTPRISSVIAGRLRALAAPMQIVRPDAPMPAAAPIHSAGVEEQ